MFKKQFKPVMSIIPVLTLLICLALLAGCGTQASNSPAEQQTGSKQETTRVITDDAGRTNTVPKEIKRVYGTSPVATIFIYTLAPEKLVGWNYDLRPEDVKYILPDLRDLPNLGGWQSKSTGNIEEIIKAHPDLIISMGHITDTDISLADKIQNQVGIPVVMVDLPLTEMDKSYEFMGDLLGVKERAEELAAYCRDTIQDIQEKAAQIPADQKVRVYYAEGAEGLQTEPQGSMHIETLEIVGGLNVAGDVAAGGKGGQTPVSLEQVLAWNPDVIISWNTSQGGAYKEITTDSRWAELKAVQDKKVYEIPTSPYNWFDRPPSVNRIIGFKWLGSLLYPKVYQYDMVKEAKEFYKKFYYYDLTDEEAKTLLANSQVPR